MNSSWNSFILPFRFPSPVPIFSHLALFIHLFNFNGITCIFVLSDIHIIISYLLFVYIFFCFSSSPFSVIKQQVLHNLPLVFLYLPLLPLLLYESKKRVYDFLFFSFELYLGGVKQPAIREHVIRSCHPLVVTHSDVRMAWDMNKWGKKMKL